MLSLASFSDLPEGQGRKCIRPGELVAQPVCLCLRPPSCPPLLCSSPAPGGALWSTQGHRGNHTRSRWFPGSILTRERQGRRASPKLRGAALQHCLPRLPRCPALAKSFPLGSVEISLPVTEGRHTSSACFYAKGFFPSKVYGNQIF